MSNLKIIKTTISVGLEKPVKLLHVTDTHITRDDPTGWNRTGVFDVDYDGCAEDYFFQAIDYAKQHNMPVLHTGDLIDFFSEANFDFIDKYFKDVDYIYAVGNHDFCHRLGEAKEDTPYKWEKIKEIAPHIKDNLYFDSRIIGGLNIVTLDNSYYLMTDGQIDLLKAEAAKGYPILLCMHVPLHAPGLSYLKSSVAYVMGAPEELLATYPEDRRLQQTPDEATLRAIDYIKSEPLIKALITGHKHLNYEEMLDCGIMQYTTHGSFAGYVREITVI
jgi:predicted phosphodiesterase